MQGQIDAEKMDMEIAIASHRLKVLSWWQMLVILADGLNDCLSRLEGEINDHIMKAATPAAVSILDPQAKQRFVGVLKLLETCCREQELDKTLDRCIHLRRELEYVCPASYTDFDREHAEPKFDYISRECDALKLTAGNELESRKVVFVPAGKRDYLEQDALFGEAVNRVFQDARKDIRDAGNCLALDLHTACIFHLMRVAEQGLRQIAKNLEVKTLGTKKKVPIESGTWEQIIQALENKANASFPKTKNGREKSDFYKGVFIEYRAFKDYWRNKVMHNHTAYIESDALHAFEHVKRFMQRLSEKMK